MKLPEVDSALLTKFLVDLLKSPSPTGFAQEAIALTDHVFRNLPGVKTKRLPRGGLMVTVPGGKDDAPRGLTAHADTLGAMVKAIKPNGRLMLTKIGGVIWNTVEGEGCTIYTREGKRIRGSILVTTASIHVFAEKLAETPRKEENMEVRLDERVTNAEETRALGIAVGDFVSFDPRVELTNGFVRSRHLDDKACVACLVEAVRALTSAGLKPAQTAYIYINNYEEHGFFSPMISRHRSANCWRWIWQQWARGKPLMSITPPSVSRTPADLITTGSASDCGTWVTSLELTTRWISTPPIPRMPAPTGVPAATCPLLSSVRGSMPRTITSARTPMPWWIPRGGYWRIC